MNRLSNILWGIALLIIGVLLILNLFGIVAFTLFFAGWWTLFLIIPAIVGIICNSNKMADIVLLIIGIILFLCAQNIIDWSTVWKFALPIIIILIGLKLIFSNRNQSKSTSASFDSYSTISEEHSVSFSENTISPTSTIPRQIKLNANFGSLNLDLRNATIQDETIIFANANFGGIKIIVPFDVKVETVESGFFGGTKNNISNTVLDGNISITIITNCKFGGVTITN